MTTRLAGALLATSAAVFLLFGTELVMIASLQTSGQTGAIPVVNAGWSLASLSGGFVYGLVRRDVPLAGLVVALGIATVLGPLAALGRVVIMIGAAITHGRRGETSMIAANLVLLVLAAVVAWGRFGSYHF